MTSTNNNRVVFIHALSLRCDPELAD